MKVSKNGIRSVFPNSAVLACWWFIALSLGSVSVNAATRPGFNNVPIKPSGSSAQIGYPGASPAAFPGVGNINPTSGSGWTTAGNYGVPPAATGATMNMGINGGVFFSGVTYPFQAGYAVPTSALWNAAQGVVSAAAALSGGLPAVAAATFFATAPFMLDWLTKAGGRVAADGSGLERRDIDLCTTAPCYEYMTQYSSTYYKPKCAACKFVATKYPNGVVTGMVGNACQGTYTNQYGSTVSFNEALTARSISPSPLVYLPSSMDDISPYMVRSDVNPDGRVVSELLDKSGDITMPTPTVTGPSSIQGPEKTTTNSDGTRTVERTTYNFSTSGNTITNTSNVTTTTNYNTDNSVRSSSMTTVTPTPETKPQSECEKNPDAAGCQKTDIPTVKVPTRTETITWAEENLGFGGGSCPAPVAFNTSKVNGSVSFQFACDFITTYVRPLMIMMAFLGAFFIVAPIKEA